MVRVSTAGADSVRAFLPDRLPPKPPLSPEPELREALDRALIRLGRLDSVAALLPDTKLFLYSYVRKEAVLSSQIEGTQSSLSDLLLFEVEQVPGVPINDAREVSRYVAALEHGLKRLRGGLPISNRLIREVHGVLLSEGRGSSRSPGEFRRSQNWIGGTGPGDAAFVPPPHDQVADCMAELERFLHDMPERTSPLLKAGLAHVQFETIHPFLDGNGRVGRLLIILILCEEEVLREPLLYLSLYFKQNRQKYYELLDLVRLTGDWEAWLLFFADAVATVAQEAVDTASSLTELFRKDRERIGKLGRSAGSALRVHHEFQRRPIANIGLLCRATHLTVPTVSKALDGLIREGLVREVTGRKRNRVFAYEQYLAQLNEGTETP